MRCGIKNILRITCVDVDLTTVTDIQFYVRQQSFFRQYAPVVVSATTMTVEVPEADAVALSAENISMQFAYTDVNSCQQASRVKIVPCDDFLKEAGYSASN